MFVPNVNDLMFLMSHTQNCLVMSLFLQLKPTLNDLIDLKSFIVFLDLFAHRNISNVTFFDVAALWPFK